MGNLSRKIKKFLSPVEVQAVEALLNKYTDAHLAARFGVVPNVVGKIRRGTHRHSSKPETQTPTSGGLVSYCRTLLSRSRAAYAEVSAIREEARAIGLDLTTGKITIDVNNPPKREATTEAA